jgi:hypothetical protein
VDSPSSPLGRAWEFFQLLTALLACCLVVSSLYGWSMGSSLEVERVITIIFIADYLLHWFCAFHWLAFPFRYESIADALAILPGALAMVLGEEGRGLYIGSC